MKYAKPLTETLSVTNAGTTYSFEVFKVPTTITGVVDEDYPEYSPDATYNAGEYLIVPELKRIYRTIYDDTKGVFPPADKKKFVDYGFINSYKMFANDEQIGAVTIGKNICIETDFNCLDTIGIVDVKFISLKIEQIDNDTNTTTTYNIDGKDIGCLSLGDYFYSDAADVTRVIKDNLEWLPNSTLKLTFTGDIEIGTMVFGNVSDLGITLYGTSLSFEDKSVISTNEFTSYREVLRSGHIRVLTAKVLFDIEDFNLTCQKVPELIGKNALYIPTELDIFSEMTNIAYIEKLPLPVINPNKIESTITMIGVPKQ